MRRGRLSELRFAGDAAFEGRDQVTVARRVGNVMELLIRTDGQPDRKVKWVDFPEVRQVYNFDCGAAAMRTILNFYGFDVREDKIMQQAGTNDDGTNPSGLAKVAESYGLKWKIGRMSVDGLKRMIDRGMPVLVLIQAWSDDPYPDYSGWEDGHYVVAVGYDDRGRIYFEDPSSPLRVWMSEDEFNERWHSIGEGTKRTDHFAMLFYGRKPKYRATNFVHLG
jgi:ABC-type bacteriocin/lantibiotic exporter with double-glycine peptidase domain